MIIHVIRHLFVPWFIFRLSIMLYILFVWYLLFLLYSILIFYLLSLVIKSINSIFWIISNLLFFLNWLQTTFYKDWYYVLCY